MFFVNKIKKIAIDSHTTTCLPPQQTKTAISASKALNFETPEKPDLVLDLLRNHGFTKTQIANLVRIRPRLLLANPDKTLLPKLQFFHSIDVSRTDLATTLSVSPTLLCRSLQNGIIPCYNFIKSVLQSDKKVVAAMKRSPWLFLEDHRKCLVPNIDALRGIGVPESSIVLLLTHFAEALMKNHEHNKLIWDRSYETYRKWGWSDDDVLTAFRKHPNCMLLSEKKISRAMDVFVNKMGWHSKEIVRSPVVLFFNLEKEDYPKVFGYSSLVIKRLGKERIELGYDIHTSGEVFLGKEGYQRILEFKWHDWKETAAIPGLLVFALYRSIVPEKFALKKTCKSLCASQACYSKTDLSDPNKQLWLWKWKYSNTSHDLVRFISAGRRCSASESTDGDTISFSITVSVSSVPPSFENTLFCKQNVVNQENCSRFNTIPCVPPQRTSLSQINFFNSRLFFNKITESTFLQGLLPDKFIFPFLVRKRPQMLLANPDKTLLPKIEFFQSIGVSRTDLARSLSSNPALLGRSLEHQIVPCYNYLKSVLQSDKKVVAAMNHTHSVFLKDLRKYLLPNIDVLREIRVPESSIAYLLNHFPEAIMKKNPNRFSEVVNEVKEMGFDPLKVNFVLAVHAISGDGNKLIWGRCYEAYRKWGWSEDDILSAFRKHPQCMISSEKKISGAMDVFVNKMGRDSKEIARCPIALLFSLEKRILPRCSVIQVLSSKGLVKKDLRLSTILGPVEKHFLERFVIKYEEKVPQLLSVYQGEEG
ncbi:mitochondrial transcription termination factor family protein [Actinidia rufa]|uniref:Mitochondrial transcription termination factor family protein n=1 Tax=Actinidia rufa TaxID=165716 RepID=A0A7J0G1G9_9ERIC|nr:mitochondrial transcription termination factor family protein [Actinidia rufa]